MNRFSSRHLLFASDYRLARLLLASLAGGGLALGVLVACGRVDAPGSVGSTDGGEADGTVAIPPGNDGGVVFDVVTVDVALSDAGVAPDGGPPPVVACATDGGVTCPLPPSVCLDDHWLRFYTGGECDAGTCVYRTVEYACPAAPIKPDCVNGGCRISPVLR